MHQGRGPYFLGRDIPVGTSTINGCTFLCHPPVSTQQMQHAQDAQQQAAQQPQQQQQQQLSTYNKLRIEIGRKLASVESSVLFAKLDVDGSNGLSRKEFMRLLLSVSKPNTNKETIRKAWREAIKGDVGKAELNINDLVDWIRACGEWAKQNNLLQLKKN